jgi:TolB-like protein/DNA-binding winged helix-turn-helix (wHTH) protein/Tfp pilus assembly protein PilF
MAKNLQHADLLQFGVFQLDLKAAQLRKSGRVVSLPPQPFNVLTVLVRRKGELVTREELRKEIWGGQTVVDFDAGLNFAINKIRTALGDGAASPRYIETIPRRGYRFLAPVEMMNAADESPVPEIESQLPKVRPSRQRSRRRRFLVWTVICVIAISGLLIGSIAGIRDRIFSWARHERSSLLNRSSVAVLPFDNLSHNPSDESFVDGMTEALITELGKISGLRVISRTSSFRYRGAAKSVPEIGRRLGAGTIVEGAVLHLVDRVRVTVQATSAATDAQLWSESYEREIRDVLSLQGEVARLIAQAVSVRLTAREQHELARPRRVDPEAYQAYVHGRLLWNKQSLAAINQSIVEFERAIKKDPTFALAYAGLADAYASLPITSGTLAHEAYGKAKAVAQKALEIDPNLAVAVNVLAEVSAYSWEWREAERLFKRALELNPSYAQAYHDYGFCLLSMNRIRENIEWNKKARMLDPLSVYIAADLAWTPYFLRRYDEAIRNLEEIREMDTGYAVTYVYLALAFQQKSSFSNAIAAAEKAAALDPANYFIQSTLGHIYGKAGNKDKAFRILRELQAKTARQPIPAFHFGMLYLGLGDTNEAMNWLEKAYSEHFYVLSLVNAMPEFDPLRSDPRFQQMLKGMGLTQ